MPNLDGRENVNGRKCQKRRLTISERDLKEVPQGRRNILRYDVGDDIVLLQHGLEELNAIYAYSVRRGWPD